MFRVVVKSNLTMYLAQDYSDKIDKITPFLEKGSRHMSLKSMVSKLSGEHNVVEEGHQAC
jgi:hypothetical protein